MNGMSEHPVRISEKPMNRRIGSRKSWGGAHARGHMARSVMTGNRPWRCGRKYSRK